MNNKRISRIVLTIVLLCSASDSFSATFGDNTGTNADYVTYVKDTILSSPFTCDSNGTADSMYVYVMSYGIMYWKMGIYTAANAIVDTSAWTSITGSTTQGRWITVPLVIKATLTAGTKYTLCCWAQGGTYNRVYCETVAGDSIDADAEAYGNIWPSTLSLTNMVDGKHIEIYCTYAASKGQIIIVDGD